MKLRAKLSHFTVFDLFIYAIMIFLIIVTLLPFLNILAISLSDYKYISRVEVNLIPKGFNITMYKVLFQTPLVMRGYLNTVLYAGGTCLIVLVLNSIYAYALSKPDLPFKLPLTIFLVITMFVSGGLIPLYLVVLLLHGIDSFWVMVLPGTVGAWTVLMMRTFFNEIPYSLTESAMIDGANEAKILTSIIAPLSKPLIATISLWTIVAKWNSWFDSQIYLHDVNKYSIQMIVREVTTQALNKVGNGTSTVVSNISSQQATLLGKIIPLNYTYAMLIMVCLPIIILYPFFQRYFVQGTRLGSIKG